MRSRFRHRTPSATACALAIAAVLGMGDWTPRARAQQPSQSRADGEVVEVRPDFYMIAGLGGNVAVQLGPIGAIVVDTGSAQTADKVLAAVKRLTNRPIRYIINTSADADHVGGNETLSKAGVTILSGSVGNRGIPAEVIDSGGLASVLAHENVLARMSAPSGSAAPFALWPTKVYTGTMYPMYLNGDGIQVLLQPAAHTDGDSIVFFRRADVIATGDIIDESRFPVIDLAKGGSIQGEIDALNRVLDLVIPPFPLVWQDARTYVIPGHGRLMDHADVVEYRDMVTIMRDAIQDLVGKSLTLGQVKAADPTKGFRKQYGADGGPWTTDMFVEAVYKNLTAKSLSTTK